MASEESSRPRAIVRLAKRGCSMPAALASVSSSQSPDFRWRAHGDGWSAINSSRTVLRVAKTLPELVSTFIPGSTGRTQEALSTRAPVSTTQSRHTPTGVSFCRWHSVGIAIPFIRAASKTLVPGGTDTARPSIVMLTSPGGEDTVAIIYSARRCRPYSWPNTYTLSFDVARCISETYSTGALPFQNMSVDFGAKMFQHRLDGRRNNLTKTADGCEPHGQRQFLKQRQVGAILCFRQRALGPTRQQVHHFLRTDAAWHALAARLVAIEAHSVQGHVQHAGGVIADDDGTGAQHGAGIGERFKIQTHVHHRSR